MSGLFDSLTSAATSLNAHRMGLDVAGQNIANVNTEGYSRRRLVLAEVPPTDSRNAGRGVDVVRVQALRDRFTEARIRLEQQSYARDAATVSGLTTVEAALGFPGDSLDARLTAFFDAFATFAADVQSPTSRGNVVTESRALARGFNDMAERLASARRDADLTVRGAVDELNTLAERISLLNAEISGANGADVEALRDQRGVALAELSQLAEVAVLERPDGAVDVAIGQGRALVVGGMSYRLEVEALPVTGFAALTIGGNDISGEITTGEIGGLLGVRDTTIPAYQTRLDQLAYDVITQVNTAHTAGFDANGNPAGVLFTAPAGVAGAAAAFELSAAIAADSQLVAGSLTGTAGDNQTARAIAALRDARVMSGGAATASEAWSTLVYGVGSDIAAARASGQAREQVVSQLQRLRDSTSKVSIDEEAAQLMRFQRAYEANARYFTTVLDTIDSLMQMVR